MSEPKLKACPFCGETPDVDDPRTFVASQGAKWGAIVCCITGPEVRTDYKGVEHWRDLAISAWNRRATGDTDSREAPDYVEAVLDMAANDADTPEERQMIDAVEKWIKAIHAAARLRGDSEP